MRPLWSVMEISLGSGAVRHLALKDSIQWQKVGAGIMSLTFQVFCWP